MATLYQVAKLYVATFNRAPDQEGLLYWVNASGLSLEGIAQSFFDQSETQTLYPIGTSLSTFVTAVYDNLFNRPPDAEGLTYWIQQLESGNIAKHHFILAVINGAQNTAISQDATILENKTSVGLSFSNAGFNDTQHASEVMSNIDATQQSVSDALSQINNWLDPLRSEALHFSKIDTDVGALSNSLTYGVSALDSGSSWYKSTITYSFNTSIPDEYYSAVLYTGDSSLTDGWRPLAYTLRTAVNKISSEVNELLGIKLQYTTGTGDIRYNQVDSEWEGFAYYPSTSTLGGDVFISNASVDDTEHYTFNKGGNGWSLIAHELGHALGLKHPFEDGDTLFFNEDNSSYTVMSYTAYNNYSIKAYIKSDGIIQLDYVPISPLLYSLYDVAALQSIYGANLSTRTGDTTYTITFDLLQYLTIWDAGGNDTIDCSGATGKCNISLEDGTVNSADIHTFFEQMSATEEWAHSHGDPYNDFYITNVYTNIINSLYTGEKNLAIAKGVIIENLYTGSGNDIVWDNSVDNIISTGVGDDTIYLGEGGWDSVDGGSGTDTLDVDVLASKITIEQIDSGEYRLIGNDFAVDVIGVEKIAFSDGSTALLSTLV